MAGHRQPVSILVYRGDGLAAQYAQLIRVPRQRVRVHVAGTAADAEAAISQTEVLWAWKLPPELYAKAACLRWVQTMGAGVDSTLVPELPSGVLVTRAPGIFGPWMAEYVLAWCLWVTQRVETYRAAQRERRWRAERQPERLAGRTLVVVGLGDIGRTVARQAKAVGMRVVGVSRLGRRVSAVARVYRRDGLAGALAEGDFVALILPLTPATRGLIAKGELEAMKPTAWLLNLGRGPLVDETALLQALSQRRIAGAVLDVFATEPLPPEHPLWALDNAVITPHIAGPDIPGDIAQVFNDNLGRYLAGRPLRHLVDRRRGY